MIRMIVRTIIISTIGFAVAFLFAAMWKKGWLETAPLSVEETQKAKEQEVQQKITEADEDCLTADIWHFGRYESDEVKALIGVTLANARKGRSFCTVLEDGTTSVPDKGSTRGKYIRSLWVIWGLSRETAATRDNYNRSRDVALKIIAAIREKKSVNSILPPNLAPHACAIKIVRNWDRSIATPDADLKELREGKATKSVWISPDKTEFFCPR